MWCWAEDSQLALEDRLSSYEPVAADGYLSRKLIRSEKKLRKDDNIMKKKIGLLMIVVMLLISSGCFVPFPYWGGGGGGWGHGEHGEHWGGEHGGRR
jgi:hypothetical protein